ncbi:hypothetical protein, partial [Klebsiella pneumoniae]
LMMSLWDALRMNMMISYQELVRTFPSFFIMPPFFADDENKAWLMLAIFTKSIVLISSNIRMSLSLRSWRNETRGKY